MMDLNPPEEVVKTLRRCTVKEINKTKQKNLLNGRNTCKRYNNKGLKFKIYKQLMPLNIINSNNKKIKNRQLSK